MIKYIFFIFPIFVSAQRVGIKKSIDVIINFECNSLKRIDSLKCNFFLTGCRVYLEKITDSSIPQPLDTFYLYPNNNNQLCLKSLKEGVYRLSIQNTNDTVVNGLTFIVTNNDIEKQRLSFTYSAVLKLKLSKQELEDACFCGIFIEKAEFPDGVISLNKFIYHNLSIPTKRKLFFRHLLSKPIPFSMYIMVDKVGNVLNAFIKNKENLPPYLFKDLEIIVAKMPRFKPALVYRERCLSVTKYDLIIPFSSKKSKHITSKSFEFQPLE